MAVHLAKVFCIYPIFFLLCSSEPLFLPSENSTNPSSQPTFFSLGMSIYRTLDPFSSYVVSSTIRGGKSSSISYYIIFSFFFLVSWSCHDQASELRHRRKVGLRLLHYDAGRYVRICACSSSPHLSRDHHIG